MRKALTVLALVALGVVVFLVATRRGAVTIDVVGPAGTKFTGSWDVDGETSDLSGVVPAHFSVECRRMTFAIELPAEDMEVAFATASGLSGRTGSGRPSPTYVYGMADFGPTGTDFGIQGGNTPQPHAYGR